MTETTRGTTTEMTRGTMTETTRDPVPRTRETVRESRGELSDAAKAHEK